MLDLTQTRANRELLPVDSRPEEPGTTSSSRSWLRPVIGLALLVLVLSVIIREGFKLDWTAAWHDVRHANLALLILAALVFATAAPLRALRWRWLLGATTRTLPAYPRLLAIWVQGWAGNCVTIAQLGDVWRATLLQQEAGVPRATTLGTIVVERLTDLAVLTLLLLAATVTLVDTRATQVQTIGVVGFAVVVMAAVAVIVFARWRTSLSRWLPPRIATAATSLAAGAQQSLPRVPGAAALSVAGWLLEGGMVWLLARAIGAPLSPGEALVTALVGALLTAIPLTPSGLGFTEAGLVVVLMYFGLPADAAAALTVLMRLFTYWGVVAIGVALSLRRGLGTLTQNRTSLTQERNATMAAPNVPRRGEARPYQEATVEIVIPVYNEEAQLAKSVETLRAYLDAYLPYRWTITVADNASTDRTLQIARGLTADPRIQVLHLEQKGRGRALKAAWLASPADVVAYMDVDLSTNLTSFLPLIAPLIAGHSDVSIGSRLQRGAVVTRQWKREILSRGYNLLLKLFFRNGFSDAQCGFKAMTRSAARALLPHIEDDQWFFDTELLLLAEEHGYRIHEVPVDWVEDLDSRVDISRTVADDLKGLWRVRTARLAKIPHLTLRPSQS